jgi:hypothetical protein
MRQLTTFPRDEYDMKLFGSSTLSFFRNDSMMIDSAMFDGSGQVSRVPIEFPRMPKRCFKRGEFKLPGNFQSHATSSSSRYTLSLSDITRQWAGWQQKVERPYI